ncbi:hypothetical protein [Pseudoalteromonas luteoviolacea]
MELTPLKIINSLRDTDCYMQVIFSQGACYKFHLFLKSLFPNATALINGDKDHIVTLIDGFMYDINGKVDGSFYPLSDSDMALVEGWTFAGNKYLSIGECPSCEEPLLAF